MKLVYKSIQRKNLTPSIHTIFLIAGLIAMLSGTNVNLVYGQTIGQAGNSVYDKECGTNIPNDGEAKEFLTIFNNMWGPDAEEASPGLKETYDCVNEIYEQETGNDIKTQLDDQYDCKDPIDCLSEAMLRDQRDGGIDDDGDGEGSDDKDDSDPNIQ